MADSLERNTEQLMRAAWDEDVGAVGVSVQDQTTVPFQYYLMREDKTDITLTAPASIGDSVINVSPGHGFTGSGESAVGWENNRLFQAKVLSVAVDSITLDEPLSFDMTTAATIVRGVTNLAVDGSVTPQIFKYLARQTIIPIDITTVLVNMVHSTVGDDSKFGNLTELSTGLLFRSESDVVTGNLGNFSKNGTFREFAASVDYTDKGGGGAFATDIRFDIRRDFGVVIRNYPSINQTIFAQVRDDLSGLTSLRVSLTGHFTSGEV